MAVPSNTQLTFSQVGIREDLSDLISIVDPTETPFISHIKRKEASARAPEWQIMSLVDPNPDNKTLEGDDLTNEALNQPVRNKNHVQIFKKTIGVSFLARDLDTAGRRDEMAFQLTQKTKEIKRDMEARFTGNYASVAGAAGTASEAAGIEAWLTSNVSRGATGANGGYNSGTGLAAAATDGTTRVATEALLKSVIASAFTNGGKPNIIMTNVLMKQKFSTFAGIATQYRDNPNKTPGAIIAAADTYVSDFGVLSIVPNRFMGYGTGRTRNDTTANQTVLCLDYDSWALRFAQPLQQRPLALTGLADRRTMFATATLECANQKKNGVLADVTTA